MADNSSPRCIHLAGCMCASQVAPPADSSDESFKAMIGEAMLHKLQEVPEVKPKSGAEWTQADILPLMERAMQLSINIGCDCDRGEVDACQRNCLGSQIWDAVHRARKLIRALIFQPTESLSPPADALTICERCNGSGEVEGYGGNLIYCGLCSGTGKNFAARLTELSPPADAVEAGEGPSSTEYEKWLATRPEIEYAIDHACFRKGDGYEIWRNAWLIHRASVAKALEAIKPPSSVR